MIASQLAEEIVHHQEKTRVSGSCRAFLTFRSAAPSPKPSPTQAIVSAALQQVAAPDCHATDPPPSVRSGTIRSDRRRGHRQQCDTQHIAGKIRFELSVGLGIPDRFFDPVAMTNRVETGAQSYEFFVGGRNCPATIAALNRPSPNPCLAPDLRYAITVMSMPWSDARCPRHPQALICYGETPARSRLVNGAL